jgi:hypothetical protein
VSFVGQAGIPELNPANSADDASISNVNFDVKEIVSLKERETTAREMFDMDLIFELCVVSAEIDAGVVMDFG